MYSLKPYSLLLSFFLLLLHNAAASDPLFSSCSDSNNYTDNDPFANNLNRLMAQLTSNSPCTGYALSSIDHGPNRVNGLALCRADVNRTTCKSCIHHAYTKIRQLCPWRKQGKIWFDECLLRYSDVEFFGEIDTKDVFILVNTQNASSPLLQFDVQVMHLMNSLKVEACRAPALLFAVKEMDVGHSEKLYGLAQCTRDLSIEDCGECLEKAIAQLPGCCGGRRGARVVGGSCSVRYEMYPFYTA